MKTCHLFLNNTSVYYKFKVLKLFQIIINKKNYLYLVEQIRLNLLNYCRMIPRHPSHLFTDNRII